MVRVETHIAGGDWSARLDNPPAFAARAIEAAFAALPKNLNFGRDAGRAVMEVAVLLADDVHMRGLNKTWRGKDSATNVLSFPAADPCLEPEMEGGVPVRPLGDIVLAFETVAGEAQAQGKTFADHCAHLLVHGLLHLAGFDHEEDGEAEAMEALETQVLADLGVGDPYMQDKTAASAERSGARPAME